MWVGVHPRRELTRPGGRPPTPDVFSGWRDDPQAEDALERLAAVIAVTKAPTEYVPSSRECEAMQLAAWGLSNRRIAEAMGCSVETVKSHLKNATRRLDANNRTHLIAIAWRRCLID